MKPITTNEIGWGEYKGYEGPYFRGIQGLTPVMRDDPTPLQKIYYVITNTEGSNYSAINMYDQMILSVGAIQRGLTQDVAIDHRNEVLLGDDIQPCQHVVQILHDGDGAAQIHILAAALLLREEFDGDGVVLGKSNLSGGLLNFGLGLGFFGHTRSFYLVSSLLFTPPSTVDGGKF